MAIQSIKSTYSLDLDTVRLLEEMARRWGVSKSEALRRAIRASAEQSPSGGQSALDALDELQRSVNLSKSEADAWLKEARAQRRAASARRETRAKWPDLASAS